jgi:hypothetical protein
MTMSQHRLARAATAAACIAIILAPALEGRPAWGQSPAPLADQPIPRREGNVYDHKSHQPTQADVEAAEKAANADTSPPSRARRDNDIENLRQEIEQLEQAYPPNFPVEDPGRRR